MVWGKGKKPKEPTQEEKDAALLAEMKEAAKLLTNRLDLLKSQGEAGITFSGLSYKVTANEIGKRDSISTIAKQTVLTNIKSGEGDLQIKLVFVHTKYYDGDVWDEVVIHYSPDSYVPYATIEGNFERAIGKIKHCMKEYGFGPAL